MESTFGSARRFEPQKFLRADGTDLGSVAVVAICFYGADVALVLTRDKQS